MQFDYEPKHVVQFGNEWLRRICMHIQTLKVT